MFVYDNEFLPVFQVKKRWVFILSNIQTHKHWDSQHNDERGEGILLIKWMQMDIYRSVGDSDDTDYDGATLYMRMPDMLIRRHV